jgi:hypothetical protein
MATWCFSVFSLGKFDGLMHKSIFLTVGIRRGDFGRADICFLFPFLFPILCRFFMAGTFTTTYLHESALMANENFP